MVGMLQAPPGTRLFDRLKGESRLVNVFSGDNVDGSTNIIPRMGLEPLLDGYRSIMKQLYSPKNYYRRIKILLRDLKTPEFSLPMNYQRFLAILRSAFRLGVLGRERYHYWHLLLWIMVRKPRLASVAITLAIYGYHYRKICEQYIY